MSTKVKGVTQAYTIVDNNDGSITWQIPALKGEVKLPLDGTQAHPAAPAVPDTLTIGMTKVNTHKYTYDEMLNGKKIESGVMVISKDGR